MKYRVKLQKPKWQSKPEHIFSPSLINAHNPIHIREWEIEADSEDQIKTLLKQAQDQGIENVQGYTLRSITEIPEQLNRP